MFSNLIYLLLTILFIYTISFVYWFSFICFSLTLSFFSELNFLLSLRSCNSLSLPIIYYLSSCYRTMLRYLFYSLLHLFNWFARFYIITQDMCMVDIILYFYVKVMKFSFYLLLTMRIASEVFFFYILFFSPSFYYMNKFVFHIRAVQFTVKKKIWNNVIWNFSFTNY